MTKVLPGKQGKYKGHGQRSPAGWAVISGHHMYLSKHDEHLPIPSGGHQKVIIIVG